MSGRFASIVLSCLLGSLTATALNAHVIPTPGDVETRAIEEYKARILTPPRSAASPDQVPVDDPAATHVQFQTREDALNWARSVSDRLAASAGAKTFKVLPLTDPRYAVLQAQVHELWLAYETLFPDQTEGLNEPPVVLIESEVVNAFVPRHIIQTDRIAHTVIVLTALVDLAGGADKRELLTGVFGHELAHSVFRHLLPDSAKVVKKFYDPATVNFGFQARRDPELESRMEDWVEQAVLTGDLTYEELNDLPSQGVSTPVLMKVWDEMLADLAEPSVACDRASAQMKRWKALQVYSPFAQEFTVDAAGLRELSDLSPDLARGLKACFQDRRRPFVNLMSDVLRIPVETLTNLPEIVELATEFDAADNPVNGLQSLVKPLRAAMLAIETSLPFARLQYFTEEEHADDLSLIVHKQLGWNQLSLNSFFTRLLPADVRAPCDKALQSATLPPGGSFSDPHRATCYRIVHLDKLKRAYDMVDARTLAREYVRRTLGD